MAAGFQEIYRQWQRREELRHSSLFSSWTIGKPLLTGLLWLAPFLPVSDGRTKSLRTSLPEITRHSEGGLEPKFGALPPRAGSNTEFSSSSKNMDEGLAKIFDEILQQVFSKVPFDETRTAGKSITKREVKESLFPPVSDGRTKSLRTSLPEIIRHSEGGLEPKFGALPPRAGYPQKKSLKNSEFVSSSNKREEHFSKLFDEILQQVFYKAPYGTPFDEARTAGKSITKRDMNSEIFIKGPNVAGYSTAPRFLFGSVDRISTNDHNSEKRDKESSLSNRNMNEPFTAINKETLEEAAKTEIPDKTVPCEQLLQFLQRNIIIGAGSVAGVLVVTALLLLALTMCCRRKQQSHPPANMTYNIFILRGKTWWQKFQEKNPKKQSEKQKQLLKGKSSV
ncbi:uncharacterized protein C2orf92 homolog isoform X1 [Lontra canadensis]|uniref:uncharacterized protein C2orf92 homolog isoform X1 n=2 Tax=Lontra canadensis TaxID=76717 RepID=UPI0013F39CBD|nr:uncharacterized protein C2orf92 homolog isoform X1 [Lontra canadensis]